MLGNEISILIDEYKDAGMHEAIFDSGRLASGCYLCRFEANNHIETKKLILLK